MVRAVLSLFLWLRKNYSGIKRNGQGQIKTCRRKQHVKAGGMKWMPNLFCGIFAVGGNYNLTHDNWLLKKMATKIMQLAKKMQRIFEIECLNFEKLTRNR